MTLTLEDKQVLAELVNDKDLIIKPSQSEVVKKNSSKQSDDDYGDEYSIIPLQELTSGCKPDIKSAVADKKKSSFGNKKQFNQLA